MSKSSAPVTIKHLATELGLSHSTVSRALNGHPLISEKTRQRIEAAALRAGYVVNRAAQSMKLEHSSTVGLVVPDIKNGFYATVAKEIADTCNREARQLVLANTNDNSGYEYRAIRSLLELRAQSVIISATVRPLPETLTLLKRLRVVQLIRRCALIDAPIVEVEDAFGTSLATRHLIELGHRRIGYIGPSAEISTGANRLAGYSEALKGANMRAAKAMIRLGASHPEFGQQALSALMSADDAPTAIVLGSPELTEGALQAAQTLSLDLPGQLSIVCYGDRPWYAFARPALTAIRLPESLIAERCSALAFEAATRDVCARPELIVRSSTALPRVKSVSSTAPGKVEYRTRRK